MKTPNIGHTDEKEPWRKIILQEENEVLEAKSIFLSSSFLCNLF